MVPIRSELTIQSQRNIATDGRSVGRSVSPSVGRSDGQTVSQSVSLGVEPSCQAAAL
jgi:hypothetical protein